MTKSIISETSGKNSKNPLNNLRPLPSQAELRRLFTYNGFNLIRRVRTSGRVSVGDVAGNVTESGYRVICVNNISYKAHRLIWIFVYGSIDNNKILDHVNTDRADNRICNLREVTFNENLFNTYVGRGYYFHTQSQKWRARLRINKKDIHLGCYKTAAEARVAYLAAKKVYHVIKEPQENIDERNRLQKYYEMTS